MVQPTLNISLNNVFSHREIRFKSILWIMQFNA